ncbi:hypothetical protein ACN28S_25250 [Cystobacter fuscus]
MSLSAQMERLLSFSHDRPPPRSTRSPRIASPRPSPARPPSAWWMATTGTPTSCW